MLKWLQRPSQNQPPAPDAALPGGWFAPQSAEQLLATPLRQASLRQLRQLTPLPDTLFDSWILTAINRFAALVQLLPASQSHHHSIPGGLLDHSLEVACNTIRLRQGYLLPPESGAEEQARQASAWTVAVVCAALLHDTGKIAVDMEIHQLDSTRWHPWQGNLAQPYRWQYQSHGRDYHLHPAAGAMLINQLIPSPLLDWLTGYPAAFASLIYQLTGHYERAGALTELVQQADKASVARYLGGDIKTALAQKPSSFPQQLLSALRSLVQNEYRLNNPECGSDGWLTEDALWLISKTTADRVRAWLLQHGVSSVPENNNRLFDELLTHQLIVANEDKAIWRCIIRSDKGWSPVEPLTLLRLAPSAIWEQGEQRPACFAGDVTPVSEAEPVPELSAPTQPLPEIADDPRLGDNNNFLQWLKNHTRPSGTVNTRNGKVHVVENHLFLISPGIFKIYAAETTGDTGDGWKLAQRMFQESGLALRCNDDSFIWTCEVRAPQKTGQLKGFLIEDPGLVFGEKMPVNNPWLKLVAPQN
ncbi:MobH family relaxase [Klebsiella pneumoniae]|uniref:MobH family relaxase n=1 Tax=Klebsiella pneumoniae TaxID=573 RepID=UPI000B3FB05D|nr:MobH family relaxase [Klebsiella pneumoniae]OVG41185.1 relaxase [Klebsiella pneumoniae]